MKAMATLRLGSIAMLAAVLAQPLHAELPPPVRALIEAAIATGDEAKLRVVAELARSTYPAEVEEIDALVAGFETTLAARKAAEAEARTAAIRAAGLLENWSGQGEFGAFRATGNASNAGITAGVTLERQGLAWRHRLTGRIDYQRAKGRTTREQFLARYEPNVNIAKNLFVYALAQYERDRFQGFLGRYALSGGLGYEAIKQEDIELSLKAGPAWRATRFVDGREENRIAGLVGLDFGWSITDTLKLTQTANAVAETGASAVAIIDSRNTSIDLVTGLDAAISRSLKARLSYSVEYDSNPPPGAVGTDTQSRVTLIYDF